MANLSLKSDLFQANRINYFQMNKYFHFHILLMYDTTHKKPFIFNSK